jgi:hypothetical protein
MYENEGSAQEATSTKLNNELKEYEDTIERKSAHLTLAKKQIAEIDPIISETIEAFEDFEFQHEISERYGKEENEVLNENNIIGRLAELEEFINTLITHVSYMRHSSNAPIAAIPVETLPPKDFTAKGEKIELFD